MVAIKEIDPKIALREKIVMPPCHILIPMFFLLLFPEK